MEDRVLPWLLQVAGRRLQSAMQAFAEALVPDERERDCPTLPG